MAINSEYYNDAKGAQAHIGFLLLLILTLISKDSITGAQSASFIFMSLAIPSLLVSLTVVLGENDDLKNVSGWQVKVAISTLSLGHLCGLIAFTLVISSINFFASLVFFISSFSAFLLFSIHVVRGLGEDGVEALEDYISKKTE